MTVPDNLLGSSTYEQPVLTQTFQNIQLYECLASFNDAEIK